MCTKEMVPVLRSRRRECSASACGVSSGMRSDGYFAQMAAATHHTRAGVREQWSAISVVSDSSLTRRISHAVPCWPLTCGVAQSAEVILGAETLLIEGGDRGNGGHGEEEAEEQTLDDL